MIRQVEKACNEQKKTMDKEVKKQIKPALAYLKKLVSRTKPGNVSEDQAGELRRATAELQKAAEPIL